MDVDKHQQFAERVVRNQHRVFRYIVSLVPNRNDAETLFQQTCLTLWESWERYDPSLDFGPWACGIARNHVRDFQRNRQDARVGLEADVLELLAERSLERQRLEDDRTSALRDCLSGLSAPNRALIEGYYGGSPVRDLADHPAASPNAIYKLLQRIREALHECVAIRMAGGAST